MFIIVLKTQLKDFFLQTSVLFSVDLSFVCKVESKPEDLGKGVEEDTLSNEISFYALPLP